jgi:hypothetical protein
MHTLSVSAITEFAVFISDPEPWLSASVGFALTAACGVAIAFAVWARLGRAAAPARPSVPPLTSAEGVNASVRPTRGSRGPRQSFVRELFFLPGSGLVASISCQTCPQSSHSNDFGTDAPVDGRSTPLR